jgi:hypothetical protein
MQRERTNPNRIKIHRVYSVPELAACCHVHKNTIGGWRRAGLEPVDSRKPTLFDGGAVRAFLETRRKARKRSCPPAHLYCCKCRDARPIALNEAEYTPTMGLIGKLVALCATCGTVMHRLSREADLERVMPGINIHRRPAAERLSERLEPIVNSDMEGQG